MSPHRPTARTPLFQGGDRGSIPLGGMEDRTGATTARPWKHGAVAQLGERCNGIAEVRGSNPLGSIVTCAPLAQLAEQLTLNQ